MNLVNRVLSSMAVTVAIMYAGTATAVSKQTESHTIKQIEVDKRFSPAQVQVYVNEDINNLENCTNSHRYAFSYHEGGKAMLSLLLTAKASNASVQFNLDGCQDGVQKIVITALN